ncbi:MULTISPECIES: hypothetical protein [Pseudomonas]|uniref:Uncharacterized protein n=1 Tax=Pseudomonas kuykendallii TaxID=1007099 RepID=A0A2W5CZ42_9PSED|nr:MULTISPECIES: hypothetical protein [Pseudomonas]PZP24671.1 MAG: hypothetical protein DI599_07575 [Pseudomonas kuykendallii]
MIHYVPQPQVTRLPMWRADESPLNDLDETESEIDEDQPLPDEVLENLTEEADVPAAIPDPGPM